MNQNLEKMNKELQESSGQCTAELLEVIAATLIKHGYKPRKLDAIVSATLLLSIHALPLSSLGEIWADLSE